MFTRGVRCSFVRMSMVMEVEAKRLGPNRKVSLVSFVPMALGHSECRWCSLEQRFSNSNQSGRIERLSSVASNCSSNWTKFRLRHESVCDSRDENLARELEIRTTDRRRRNLY